MSPDDFRTIALSLPRVIESAHMHHPDFRIDGKIFASLGYPDAGFGVVMLSPQAQKQFCEADPAAFVPVKGAWGRNGSTQVNLKAAKKTTLRPALKAAYEDRVRKNGKR